MRTLWKTDDSDSRDCTPAIALQPRMVDVGWRNSSASPLSPDVTDKDLPRRSLLVVLEGAANDCHVADADRKAML